MIITPEDKRMLVKADRICLRHQSGVTQFEIYANANSRTVTTMEIKSNYTGDYNKRCFSHGGLPELVKSVFRVTKKGDHVSVFWYKSAMSTDKSKENGFFGDLVLLRIDRPKRGGGFQEPLEFMFDVAFGKDNSARMI